MNYLAHLLLAEPSSESLIGNLLGDFVKGPLKELEACYSAGIVGGIAMHRQVDVFTDTHAIYRRSKRRIRDRYGLVSGIIIDVSYDHFLTNHWHSFSQDPLESFIAKIYNLLRENQAVLPEKLQQVLPKLIAENWLASYRDLADLRLTFLRISRRFKRETNLAQAVDGLLDNYAEIESDFLDFFPELMARAASGDFSPERASGCGDTVRNNI